MKVYLVCLLLIMIVSCGDSSKDKYQPRINNNIDLLNKRSASGDNGRSTLPVLMAKDTLTYLIKYKNSKMPDMPIATCAYLFFSDNEHAGIYVNWIEKDPTISHFRVIFGDKSFVCSLPDEWMPEHQPDKDKSVVFVAIKLFDMNDPEWVNINAIRGTNAAKLILMHNKSDATIPIPIKLYSE